MAIHDYLYNTRRYWFHISTTLNKEEIVLSPRSNDEGFNRLDTEPDIKRICVSPSLEQCLVAVPYHKHDVYFIYRTKVPVRAKPAKEVYDSSVTQEGWITTKTKFIKVGELNLKRVDGYIKLIDEAATSGLLSESKTVYKWWKKLDPWKYVLVH
jgi:hypothetical protein